MFLPFLRARASELLRKRRATKVFEARSATRDFETDRARIESIARSIDDAIAAAETELSGLKSRVDEVLVRAAVVSGNESDEYLSREADDNGYLGRLDVELSNGQRRLVELADGLTHLRFMRVALITRFPNYKSHPKKAHLNVGHS